MGSTGGIPRTLGKYEILRELGRGAMGVVYLGRDPRIGREVALKTIRLSAIGNEEMARQFQERFFQEARAAGRLNHPNIVTVYEADEDAPTGLSYIAMEYVDGETLEEHLKERHHLNPVGALGVMRQLLEALDYAHGEGTVHRDIKPANILMAADGRVKVTDFGIARLSASDMTRTGTVMGSPGYMSPEQVQGRRVDGRSDLFSAAVVLYQVLTGRKPFEADDLATICYQIVHVDPPPPHELDASLPREIDGVLRRALAKEPEDRYPGGASFAAALEAAVEGAAGSVPVAEEPEAATFFEEPGPPEARGRPKWLLPLLGAAVVVVIGVALALVLRGGAGAGAGEEPASAEVSPAEETEAAVPAGDDPAGIEAATPPARERVPPGQAKKKGRTPPGQAKKNRGDSGSAAARGEVETATLRLVVHHRLPDGVIRLYVDEEEIAEQHLDARLKVKKTRQQWDLQIPAGNHRVEVRVAPSGDWGRPLRGYRTREIEPGGSYTMDVDIGTLGRDLDLSWY